MGAVSTSSGYSYFGSALAFSRRRRSIAASSSERRTGALRAWAGSRLVTNDVLTLAPLAYVTPTPVTTLQQLRMPMHVRVGANRKKPTPRSW